MDHTMRVWFGRLAYIILYNIVYIILYTILLYIASQTNCILTKLCKNKFESTMQAICLHGANKLAWFSQNLFVQSYAG